ncbi:hypothetical protein Ctob_011419 [Chrysochromulina tobinii]|uniref:Uncharacterized protein n=1 Tax=Chrysochromulina tobinii TaxID=1460289 RepID=A0A0M0JPR2_9EUKA|nr:hypothetical protein Ctob_011419 [Chrysochromulina tobinii]|eukprot:KOO28569.1 hypothetical protein Ctob_011419 [Chrysochromulina sp. CCMP291]
MSIFDLGAQKLIDGSELDMKSIAGKPALAMNVASRDVQWNFDGIFLFDKLGVPASRTSIRNAPTPEQISALM